MGMWHLNAMWQRPANNIPQLTRKGYQPHGFVKFGEHFFWIFAALYGKTLHWDRVCVYVAVWYTLSWIETALQLVWRDSTPNWILDGFKFPASTVSVWWAMGEGGSSTIKLACAVKTLVFSHHKLPLANACSKIDQVCPDNMVNNNFYLQILPLWFK